MKTTPAHPWLGTFYGFLGVLCFSLTPPFTRYALAGLAPWQITAGRVAIAGLLAALLLLGLRAPIPARRHWPALLVVSLGVSIGFPLSLAYALEQTDASHAGIVLAILPLLTSVLGAWMHQERHGRAFWLVALIGCVVILAYLFASNGIRLVWADVLLLVAAISAALAYSAGAGLTRQLGGIRTISWAMVIMLPLSLPTAYIQFAPIDFDSLSTPVLSAFLYLALVSQLLGFVPWYAGLTLGGVARVSQVQLLQTFLTLFASAWLLGESVPWHGWATATLVVGLVYLARRIG